jgi:hypothetical protein
VLLRTALNAPVLGVAQFGIFTYPFVKVISTFGVDESAIASTNRPEHILAPVFFRILLRVRVLEGESTWRRGIEGGTLAVGQFGREVRVIARLRGVSPVTLDQVPQANPRSPDGALNAYPGG